MCLRSAHYKFMYEIYVFYIGWWMLCCVQLKFIYRIELNVNWWIEASQFLIRFHVVMNIHPFKYTFFSLARALKLPLKFIYTLSLLRIRSGWLNSWRCCSVSVSCGSSIDWEWWLMNGWNERSGFPVKVEIFGIFSFFKKIRNFTQFGLMFNRKYLFFIRSESFSSVFFKQTTT